MIKFEYNGIASDTKGVIVTRIQDNDSIISRSPILGEKNFYRPRENHFGMTYNNNLSFSIHMIKDPCKRHSTTTPSINNGILSWNPTPKIENGILKFYTNEPYIKDDIWNTSEYTDYFTSKEVRSITSWLTSPNYPKLLRFVDNDYFREPIVFFAVITDVSADHTDKPSELIYNVQCDSPYGYSDEKRYNVSSKSTLNTPMKLYIDTDSLEDYIYPIIKIHPISHGTLTIKNITDNGSMNIKLLKNLDFSIDCRNLKIYDTVGNIVSMNDLGIKDIDNIYFPRLCAGENELQFMGNADIEVVYREPRKVGVFG